MSILTNALAIVVLSVGILYTSYKVYGGFLVKRVFGFDPSRRTPAEEFKDGVDFVPTRPAVLFGHHFASIAGLGPIIGPAIAVYWGWVPALVWVLAGCVLVGGVHDTAALYASLRHKARGIGDLTNDIIGPRARLLFLLIIFFLLALAMGVFAIFMAGLFVNLSAEAVIPTFSLIGIAMVIGSLVYKTSFRLGPATVIGVTAMFIMVFVGMWCPVHLHAEAGTATNAWVYILLAYALMASILPVWMLLQPRDYINCFQLYAGLLLLVLGFLVWRPQITVPAFGSVVDDPAAPGLMPLLFITIACGAVSGFHNLVSSGTTARQIRRETDAQVIGYGAMLMEGFLAVLVILACVVGLSQTDFHATYGSFKSLTGINALGAFLTGASRVAAAPFQRMLSGSVATESVEAFFRNFIAVMVVSFAMTTLDSATRLLRYNVEALGKSFNVKAVQNRYVASLIAVVAIAYFALMKINGKPAGVTLWQLFGTTNQLLACLGLLIATVLLYRFGKPIIYTLVPMLLMMVSVSWAIWIQLTEFYNGWRDNGDTGNLSLLIVGGALAVMAVWMVIEALMMLQQLRQQRAASVGIEAQPTSE